MYVSPGLKWVERSCICTIHDGNADDVDVLIKALQSRKDRLVSLPSGLREAFLTLAWLEEYLRAKEIPTLVLTHWKSDAVATTILLDLRPLIETPKRCMSPQCEIRMRPFPFVWCAECRVACWCSEECLTRDLARHNIQCVEGQKKKDFFSL